MSKLSNLMGKSKTFSIGGMDFEIKPRTLRDMDLIVDLADSTKKGPALRKLIAETLKDSVPDATEEEIESIGLQYFKELSEAIVEVNGLNQNASNN